MKKIKIMLAGFVNYPNAQNINCANIAKHLDKTKFDVHALYIGGYPVDKKAYKKAGITLHYINQHRYLQELTLWRALAFGNYDIFYMPKEDAPFLKFATKNQKRKLMVSSIEGVITETTNQEPAYKDFMLHSMYDIFSISHCIADSVQKYYNRTTDVLPLGVNKISNMQNIERKSVKNIIWAGNVKENKRPMFLMECAKAFPELHFTMIGDGDMMETVKAFIVEHQLTNVTLTGRIPNEQVYDYMQKSDLLLMTSEFEGLPKVIQEAAQCGLPSIYMANNYTVDFIENGVNGYAVYSLGEMQEKLQGLLDDQEKYREMSKQTKDNIQEYTWNKLIPKYEAWFTDVLERYQKEKGNK